MELGGDTKAVLLAAGLIFLWALLIGVWKYREMAASPEGRAHPYVDVAHRAALLYSFATLLLAVFVELSDFSTLVNTIAAFVPVAFFVTAIASYCVNGARAETDNQFRDGDEPPGQQPFMWALIAGEIGGVAILIAGFVCGQIL
ncbi:MAG: hypothetical protein KDB58_01360 [Solirubrobacterales bacterium]|nr:hypothetical protein [Solirubrobacterales bacterium]MCB8971910.1 hypothetical protein [Thermoleophilales bacterium]MCO5326286.1 hypothetical protein [Solirubrobacterales bacterium]